MKIKMKNGMFSEYGNVIKGTKNTHKDVKGAWENKCNECYRQVDIRDLNDDSIYGIKYYVCNECYAKGNSNIHRHLEITKEQANK